MVAGNSSVEGGFSCYFVEISRISGVCVCVYRRVVLLPKTNRIESEIGSLPFLLCFCCSGSRLSKSSVVVVKRRGNGSS